MSEQVKRLTVAEADFKWPDDELVVHATDYDALEAKCASLAAELAHVRTALAMHDRIEKDTHDQCVMLRKVLAEAVEYLDSNRFNMIGSGSILHRQMQEALATRTKESQQ